MDFQNSSSQNDHEKDMNYENSNTSFKQEASLNFKNLFEMQLQQYDDIEDEDFQIIEDAFQQDLKKAKQYQSTYMHQHSNIIPIGTNYQALIPPILPQEHYKIRSRQMLKRLFILKINDPVKTQQFIVLHKEMVQKTFHQFQLTGQDYSLMYNNFKQYGNQGDIKFQKYLQKTAIYWDKYFTAKQKQINSKILGKKKKKKNRGSIPI